jgi:Protein of unknown function, DUF599
MEGFVLGALAASILTLAIYHIILYYSILYLHRSNFRLSRNVHNAAVWFEKHKALKDAPSVTLAIQTLRNTILVAIFVGGYAFQYGNSSISAINASFTEADFARAIILSVLFYSSFLSWANTIRTASHLGYAIGSLELYISNAEKKKALEVSLQHAAEEGRGLLSESTGGASIPPGTSTEQQSAGQRRTGPSAAEELEEILNKNKDMLGSMLWSFHFGFRFLYLSIPFAFFAAGPLALVISTFVVVFFLHMIDNVENSKMFGLFERTDTRSAP